MREILFRGKREYDNEWMYGYLVKYNERCYIYYEKPDEMYQTGKLLTNDRVIPETVGQYTGLTDKNGNRIFEGDIIKANRLICHSETKEIVETEIGFVEYDMDKCEYRLTNVNGTIEDYGKNYSLPLWRFKRDTNKVIGNIHDTPELLKGDEKND